MSHSNVKKVLLKRRTELLGEIDEREDAIASVTAEDEEDKQFERLDDEVLAALSSADRDEVTRIDAALERIASDTYGECQECGLEIAPARLLAVPDASLCIDCASRADAHM